MKRNHKKKHNVHALYVNMNPYKLGIYSQNYE